MALSYSISRDIPIRRNSKGLIPVLLTGTTGSIGSYFAEHTPEGLNLRLAVHKIDDDARKFEQYGELVEIDLENLESLKSACAGIDTVVHMAGEASPEAEWDSLLSANIIGTYNIMVAAKSAGCRRLIYASSIHAISGYPADVQVKSSDPVNPGDLYGVSKCFSEALGRYMAEQEGLSVICLRIGAFQPLEYAMNPESTAALDAWVSERDLTHMIDLCIKDEKIRYAIFNGLSDNRFKRMDITDARELIGYRPQDDLTILNPELAPLHLRNDVSSHSMADDPSEQKSGLREQL